MSNNGFNSSPFQVRHTEPSIVVDNPGAEDRRSLACILLSCRFARTGAHVLYAWAMSAWLSRGSQDNPRSCPSLGFRV